MRSCSVSVVYFSTFVHSIFEGSPSKEGFHGTPLDLPLTRLRLAVFARLLSNDMGIADHKGTQRGSLGN